MAATSHGEPRLGAGLHGGGAKGGAHGGFSALVEWGVTASWAGHVRVQESIAANPGRINTGLAVGAAWSGPQRFFPIVRGELVHQHETAPDHLRTNWLSHLFGVGHGIHHRAGVALAGGVGWKIGADGRFLWSVQATATAKWLPLGSSGVPLYATAEFLLVASFR